MIRDFGIVVAIVLGGISPCRAGTTNGFRYYATIDRNDSQGEEIVAVALDSEIFAATHDRCADVRIVDAAGREIPYERARVAESKVTSLREPCPSGGVTLHERDDGGLEISAALTDKSPSATGLTVRTPLKDFERRVSVSGSRDGSNWHVLVEDAALFDYSRYMDVSNHEVTLPANDDRQYRITIEAAADERASPLKELTRRFRGDEETERTEQTTLRERPLRIDGMDFYRLVPRHEPAKDVKRPYEVAKYEVTEDAQRKETIIHVRMRNEPLTQLVIDTSTPNFVRQAVVQAPSKRAGDTDWRDVGRATITAIHLPNFERRTLAIAFPEQWQEEYRIVISNEDSPPLEITGVTAEGNEYRLTFIATSGDTYRAYFGSAAAKEPKYDTAALMAALGGRYTSRLATLGLALDNPAYHAASNWRPLGNSVFFGIAIAIMVVALAAVMLRAMRRIDALPSED